MKKLTFEVTITSDNGKSEVVNVKARDAQQAKTIAMLYCTTKFCTSVDPKEVPTLSFDVKPVVLQ